MADSEPTESQLEAAAGAAGPVATDAFKLLGTETRLAILLALWEAYTPGVEETEVSFSELYDRVGMRDSGNFTYHLDQLTDHFVAETDEGYKLQDAGLKIVQAVIAGTGLERATVEPTELELACTRCGERSVELRYQSGAVHLTCRDCEGFMTADELPRGTIAVHELDPAGVARRRHRELRTAAVIRNKHTFHMMAEGVCPACSGTIDVSIQLCEDHNPERGQVCPECETRDSVRVRHVCTVCKNWDENPVEVLLFDHPALISFYHEHGVDTRIDATDIEETNQVVKLLRKTSHTLVATDPVRIRITVPCDGDKLQLTLDEDLDVIEVTERRG